MCFLAIIIHQENCQSLSTKACVEQFTYNPDGTIPSVSISKEGPKPVGEINPYKRVEAETMAWSEKCSISQNKKIGVYVSSARSKGYIKVREVNFGNQSPKSFSVSLAAGVDGGLLEVRLDSVKGTIISSIQLPRTGGWDKFKTFTSELKHGIFGQMFQLITRRLFMLNRFELYKVQV